MPGELDGDWEGRMDGILDVLKSERGSEEC